MPKLSDLLNESKKEDEVNEPISPQIVSDKKNDSFTIEALQKAWDTFTEQQKNKGNDLVLVSLKKDIDLVNTTEVHVALANHLEIDAIDGVKQELVSFLRKTLNNDFIDVVADVNEEKTVVKAYTNADKFKVMMDKQPVLKELKDRLGLDADH
ncbi:MAG: hypothetical protein OEX22_12575 [Cyclobacteriaceae bacterium]|nr:hypothetical protein [Cyclobacteriaceae bacterium]